IAFNGSLEPLLGKGLLTSEGTVWEKQRRIVQPAFHSPCISAHVGRITGSVEVALRRWADFAASGAAFNLGEEVRGLLIQIVGQALFSIDLATKADALARTLDSAFSSIHKAGGAAR